MTPLEIHPMEGAGAEVVSADLTAMTVGEWNQIEAAFASFGLLVFPNQFIDENDLYRFAERWGSVLPDNSRTSHGWLSEHSYRAAPTAASAMMLREPQSEHRLQVASLYNAFDALSSGTQLALEALQARHRLDDEETVHPLVIRHPISGRKVMYLNPAFTTSITDMDDAEGMALLNELFAHSLLDEFVCEIVWEPGSVVLLDHRTFLHFTEPTTSSALAAFSVAGTELAPAFRQDKPDPTFTERAGATLAAGIITAAMTGIADVLEPEKRTHDIEIVSEAPEREPLSDSLDFGDLPPLD